MSNIETNLGTANGLPIIASVAPGALHQPLVTVELSHDYARHSAPGWPMPTPAGTAYGNNPTESAPVVIPAGTILTLVAAEAAALSAVGALAE